MTSPEIPENPELGLAPDKQAEVSPEHEYNPEACQKCGEAVLAQTIEIPPQESETPQSNKPTWNRAMIYRSRMETLNRQRKKFK